LRAGGSVEFKSNNSGIAIESEVDKFASQTMSPEVAERVLTSADKKSNGTAFSQKRQSEGLSRVSNAERSLQFM